MSGEQLDPCPFCGGEAEIERYGDGGQSTIYCCTECGCRLETGETFNQGDSWNRRTETNDFVDAFKGVTASLSAAISLLENGGKKAAPSNKMFAIMLEDFRKALERARVEYRKVLIREGVKLEQGGGNER